MATVLESLRKSSINIQNINKTLSDTKKSTSSVNQSVDNISRIVATNTRVKRELFTRSNVLNSRREEASKRQEIEDSLESTRVSTSPQLGLSFTSRSEKGPLGRLLGFLGFTFAGWIVENLPTWIFMGQEFISRINSFGRSMYGMVSSMQNIIKSFGDTLGYSLNSILRLDFDEFVGEGTVARSFEELNLAVQDLGTNITDTFKLFTTPLTESLETGEQAPGLEEKQPDTMFPGVQQETAGSPTSSPSGGGGRGFGGSGVSKGIEIARRLQKDLGLKDYQAAAVVGNLLNESSQLNPAQIQNGGSGLLKVDGKTGYGWAQWTYAARQRKLYQLAQSMGIDPSKQPLTDEVNYAMLVSELPEYDSGGRFRTSRNIEEASNWLLEQYFRPEDRGTREQKERIADGQKILQTIKTTPSTPQKPTVAPQTQMTTTLGEYFRPLPQGSYKGGSGQGFGASRDGGKRKHLGLDITESNWKPGSDPRIPVVAIRGGVVSSRNYVPGEQYLSGVVVDQDDGYSVRYLHMSPSIKPGQKVFAGQRIGRLVNLGNQTHLHIELYSGSKLLDPTKYITSIERGQTPKVTSPPAAQISAQPKPSQPAAMTPERKGSQVMIIDATQPQVSQVSYPSQQQPSVTPTVSEFKMLNNFIKNKLLLDLAYL